MLFPSLTQPHACIDSLVHTLHPSPSDAEWQHQQATWLRFHSTQHRKSAHYSQSQRSQPSLLSSPKVLALDQPHTDQICQVRVIPQRALEPNRRHTTEQLTVKTLQVAPS